MSSLADIRISSNSSNDIYDSTDSFIMSRPTFTFANLDGALEGNSQSIPLLALDSVFRLAEGGRKKPMRGDEEMPLRFVLRSEKRCRV